MYRDPEFLDCIAPTTKGIDSPTRQASVVAFGVQRTDWQHKAGQRLSHVIRLPKGWDGHQGRRVDPTTAYYVYRLLEVIMGRPKVPLPTITPLSYGGIILEWHRKGWDVEIEIEAPGIHNVYVHELETGVEQEFALDVDLHRLRPIISKIVG